MYLAKRRANRKNPRVRLFLRGLFVIGFWLGLPQPNFAQSTNAPATLVELRQQLTDLVNQPRFDAARFGIKAVSLETGQTLFEHEPAKLFSPASNCKLYTMAMVLDKLGGDYRLRTSLYSAARPDARGNLKCDLILYGRGDPTFNLKAGQGDLLRALQPLVAALTNAGVRKISGDLIGDDSFIVGAPYGSGWVWDDMNYYYGAEISALTINDNTLQLSARPGAKLGAPGQLELNPPTTFVTLINQTRTSTPDSRRVINLYRPVGQNVIYVNGQLPLNSTNKYSDDVTFSNPTGLFVEFFKAALARNGVKVTGKTRTVHWLERPGAPLDTSRLIELGFVESAPLRELNVLVQKPSQNLYTDLLLAHVGSLERERALANQAPNDSAWLVDAAGSSGTSEDYGVRELYKFFSKVGIKRSDVKFEEGSGLARNNLVTPNATIQLLQFMSQHPEAESYYQALPIAGRDGTLRNRLKGTRGENNVHAKTGTLRWANSTSGYLTTAAGEKLVFSLMLNRYTAPSAQYSARGELDKAILLLANFTGRSDE